MWYQGQKVRCINGRFPVQVLDWGSNLPCEGKVYTIRRIARVPNATTGHIGPGFLLEELKNPDDRLHFDSNPFYRSDRGYSRPVVNATDQAANRRRVPPAARRKLCRERAGAPLLSAAPLWPA